MRRGKLLFTFIIWTLLGCFSLAWGADRGPIRSGETKSGFQLVGPSYMDTWTFSGNAGDRVLIDAEPTSGSTCLDVYLYPPDSGPREAWGRQWLDHELQQTGLYTIVIGECYFDDAATYDISLTKIPPQLRPGIYDPFPSNGAIISDFSDFFSWDPVTGATGYDVYFGEDVIVPLPIIRNNISSPSTRFPAMDPDKIYYWHVVAHTPGGDIEGPYWWFETVEVCYIDYNLNIDNQTLSKTETSEACDTIRASRSPLLSLPQGTFFFRRARGSFSKAASRLRTAGVCRLSLIHQQAVHHSLIDQIF